MVSRWYHKRNQKSLIRALCLPLTPPIINKFMTITVARILVVFFILGAAVAAESGSLPNLVYDHKVVISNSSVLAFWMQTSNIDTVPLNTLQFKDLPAWAKQDGSRVIANPPADFTQPAVICVKYADDAGTFRYQPV